MQSSDFEYTDFKISFSISIKAYLRRYLLISRAEEVLQRQFPLADHKAALKQSLDFNTVFKWIVSPHLAKALDKPANLDGRFWVECDFCPTEAATLEELSAELSKLRFTKKRENKWQKK